MAESQSVWNEEYPDFQALNEDGNELSEDEAKDFDQKACEAVLHILLQSGCEYLSLEDLKTIPSGILDVIQDLYRENKRHRTQKNNFTEQLERLHSEVTRLDHVNRQQEIEANARESDISSMRNQFATWGREVGQERKQALIERNKLTIRCSKLQGLDANYRAKYRRLEGQLDKLQRRFDEKKNKIQPTAKGAQRRMSIEGDVLKVQKRVNEMCQEPDAATSALVLENKALREMLDPIVHKLQKDLESAEVRIQRAMERNPSFADEPSPVEASTQNNPSPPDDECDHQVACTPAPMLCATLKHDLASRISALHEAVLDMERLNDSQSAACPHETDTPLREELKRAHTLLLEQDAVIYSALFAAPQDMEAEKIQTAFDMSMGEELNENMDYRESLLAKREDALKRQEDEATRVAESLDRERMDFEARKLFLQIDGEENNVPSIVHSAKKSSCRSPIKKSSCRSPMKWDLSPICLQLPPATPVTRRILQECDIDVPVMDLSAMF